MSQDIIYHLATKSDWEQAQTAGKYTHSSLKEEGFIHFSTSSQLRVTANYFLGCNEPVLLLRVEASKLDSNLKYDWVESRQEDFAHLYSPLSLEAVTEIDEFYHPFG